jgi:hypothetical protein
MTSSPDNGEVIDIIGEWSVGIYIRPHLRQASIILKRPTYRTNSTLLCVLNFLQGFILPTQPKSGLQEFRVRANGTIYSGVTALSNTTVLSRLPEFVDIDQGAPDPCGNVSIVVVRSTADPTYTPWRIISPAGFDVFAHRSFVK